MKKYINLKSPFTKKILITAGVVTVLFVAIKLLGKSQYITEYIFARGISRYLAVALQTINSIFPFSIIEWLFVALILALLALVVIAIVFRGVDSNDIRLEKGLTAVFAALMVVITFYSLTGTVLYNRLSVFDGLALEQPTPNRQLYEDALHFYLEGLTETSAQLPRDEENNAVCPYTFSQLNDLISAEYDKIGGDYFTKNNIRLKPIVFSKPMTYTYITGVYVAFLGEGSINTNVPAYTLPQTMAHEMAHSKGVMQESGANAVSYYILLNSSDVYLRYCGYMYACEILYSKLYDVLTEAEREEILALFPMECRIEYGNSNEHYLEYETFINDISNFINNLYLKGAGVSEGTLSYSQTDKFLCAVYLQQKD